MAPDDEEDGKTGREHLNEGKKHLRKGAQKAFDDAVKDERIEGIGNTVDRKLDYYDKQKSQVLGRVSGAIGNSKAPAASGLIVLLPVFVVYLVIEWLFGKINQIPGIENITINSFLGIKFGQALTYYASQTYRLAFLLILGTLAVTAAGKIVNTDRGFRLERLMDRAFRKIPFIGSIYSITKVTTETILGSSEDFSKPVKIEFNGMRLSGFKTGNKADDGREIVFIPTAPNITSGAVVEVEQERIIETDETSEEALTRILSAGFGQNDKEEEE